MGGGGRREVGVGILLKSTFTLQKIESGLVIIGRFSNHDDNGSENHTKNKERLTFWYIS